MFIVVDGLIAAGKTSLLKTFKDSFDCHCIYEPVDHWKETGNLERFYKALEIQDIENRSAQIYRFQTYVFQSRIDRIIRELKNIPQIVYNDVIDSSSSLKIGNNTLIFIERSIFSDRYIFMEMLYSSGMITESDYNMYKNWWNLWSLVMPIKPDAFIYLNPSIDACLERYKARNREGENIDRNYQQELKNKHDEYFKEIQIDNKKIPCLNLETDVDFRDGEGKKYVIETVKNFIDGI